MEDLLGTLVEVQRRTAVVAGDDAALYHCQYAPTIDLGPFSNFAVGDRVTFRPTASQQENIITGILPRKSKISRPGPKDRGFEELILAANVDALVIVGTLTRPEFNPRLLDRYLALAENFGMGAIICMNKADLDAKLPVELEYLKTLGYPIVCCSAKTGEGLDDLRAAMVGKMVVLSGSSGVGKSSLIISLIPGANPRVGEVRKGEGKGRHTTTTSHLYRIGTGRTGTTIIDTPGVRELGFWQVKRADFVSLWRDLRSYNGKCRFRDCVHRGEPGCILAEALKSGELPEFRYQSYLRILETLPE